MANVKISELTAASTPLAGTEVLPIVQSTATVKVSVANLTAGRAVSAASLTTTGTINDLTVGRGAGAVSTNTAVGASALAANTTGPYNTAVGSGALQTNTSGESHTAVGYRALYSNTTGIDNTALGWAALYTNSTGNNNTALGKQSLANSTTASNNTAVGYQAGFNNTTGTGSTFVGRQAGLNCTAALGNTYIGDEAGGLTTGSYNTFVGNDSGYGITSGQKITIIGSYGGNSGGLDIRTASNYIVLSDGDQNIGARWQNGGGWFQLNNSASWSTTSDRRLKENDVALTGALALISSLRPVSFNWIQTKKADVGFIAQEYQTVFPEQVTQESGLDKVTKQLINDDTVLSITQNLTPYLVAAIKELKAEFDAYKASHP